MAVLLKLQVATGKSDDMSYKSVSLKAFQMLKHCSLKYYVTFLQLWKFILVTIILLLIYAITR